MIDHSMYPRGEPDGGEEFRIVVERHPYWRLRPWDWAVFVYDEYYGKGKWHWRVLDLGLWERAEGRSRTEEKARLAATKAITYHLQIEANSERYQRKRMATRTEIKLGVHELTTGD